MAELPFLALAPLLSRIHHLHHLRKEVDLVGAGLQREDVESGREFSMGLILVMQGIGGADLGWA